MIFGHCPYDDCGEHFELALFDGQLPKLEKHVCQKCKRTIWTMHSRLVPMSWTDEAFREKYDVDEENRKTTDKPVKSA